MSWVALPPSARCPPGGPGRAGCAQRPGTSSQLSSLRAALRAPVPTELAWVRAWPGRGLQNDVRGQWGRADGTGGAASAPCRALSGLARLARILDRPPPPFLSPPAIHPRGLWQGDRAAPSSGGRLIVCQSPSEPGHSHFIAQGVGGLPTPGPLPPHTSAQPASLCLLATGLPPSVLQELSCLPTAEAHPPTAGCAFMLSTPSPDPRACLRKAEAPPPSRGCRLGLGALLAQLWEGRPGAERARTGGAPAAARAGWGSGHTLRGAPCPRGQSALPEEGHRRSLKGSNCFQVR